MCTINDLRDKQVINSRDGSILGHVCDVMIDVCDGRLTAIIIPGPAKFFGLFGREEDYIIKWCDIEKIGEDTILVCAECRGGRRKARNRFFESQ